MAERIVVEPNEDELANDLIDMSEVEVTVRGPLRRIFIEKGGAGSGHHGHAGRPGEVGGSLPGQGGRGPTGVSGSKDIGPFTVIENNEHAKSATSTVLESFGISHGDMKSRFIAGAPDSETGGVHSVHVQGVDWQAWLKAGPKKVTGNFPMGIMFNPYFVNVPEGTTIMGLGGSQIEDSLPSPEERWEAVERGGPGSGHHGHAGRPGEKGGSAPAGVQPFNESAERHSIMDMKPGGGGSPKEGISREQMQTFFNRKNATEAAQKMKYKDGTTVKDVVEQSLDEGFTDVARKQFGYVLTNPQTGNSRRFKFKQERDYIDLMLQHGIYKINYQIEEAVRDRDARKVIDLQREKNLQEKERELLKERGGKGSGHHEHKGREGEVGGSLPSGAAGAKKKKGEKREAEPEGGGEEAAGPVDITGKPGYREPGVMKEPPIYSVEGVEPEELGLPDIDPELAYTIEEISNHADTLMEEAGEYETDTTSMVTDIGNAVGAKIPNLEYRLKSHKSLSRKIYTDSIRENIAPEVAALQISDSVRYTMLFEPDEYVEKVQEVQRQLEEQGWSKYDAKWKNSFQGGDAYDGYNTVMVNEQGQRFELQYHTPESFEIKKRVHRIYERFRKTEDPGERLTMWNQMTHEWSDYVKPNGWERLEGVLK